MKEGMKDCGCDKARAMLEEYLHNELGGEDAADIRHHMGHCPDCSNEHRIGQVLTEVVQRACRETAPDDLKAQVLHRLRLMQSHE